jgi:hypothetical protein
MRTAQWVGAVVLFSSGLLAVAACSSDSDSSSPGAGGSAAGGGSGGGSGADGSVVDQFTGDAVFADVHTGGDAPQFDPDAYWADDPPPQQCFDGGLDYPVPGGTPECPDDKNREGCPCKVSGEKAPCWPGYRKNRNRGVCHDGTTTCIQKGENERAWGPCEGYQLPTGTEGAAACLCFSAGQWKISNLVPCFVDMGGGPGSAGAVSTLWNGSQAACPPLSGNTIVQPSQPWSPNTLRVDCSGHFKLCYTLKAGSAQSPQPSDCVLASVCTEADYPTANVEQAFPDLPSWLATSPAQTQCAQQFASSGGYGEMTVVGLSVECDEIDDDSGGPKVFNRVQYCPLACAQNPNGPGCENCQAGGSGSF